ncbi:MAG: winged helix-turn-helix transcriptional regulator [Thermoleophilaceae bacterium]
MAGGELAGPLPCCPHYHRAVELIGKRWTGAILCVLAGAEGGAGLRFSQIAAAVPELSDRLLSERMKELEARGVVARTVVPGPPVRVAYALTDMGQELRPALDALRAWGRRWLADEAERPAVPTASAAGAR